MADTDTTTTDAEHFGLGFHPGKELVPRDPSLGPKQDQLEEVCRTKGFRPPLYQIVSDRRGGRTAWSSSCTVNGDQQHVVNARFWYDGKNVNMAKEDAAECMLLKLGAQAPEKH